MYIDSTTKVLSDKAQLKQLKKNVRKNTNRILSL